jgi:hypothetical protein
VGNVGKNEDDVAKMFYTEDDKGQRIGESNAVEYLISARH